MNKSKMLYAAGAASVALVTQLGFWATAEAHTPHQIEKNLMGVIEAQEQQLQQQAHTLEMLKRQVQDQGMTQPTEVPEAIPAYKQPGVVKSGKERIKLTLSGQVNRGVLFTDDGQDSDIFHVDNDNSSTRVRFVGKGRVSDDFSIGTQMEVQFESNSTANVNQESKRGVGNDNFTQRKLEFYLDSKSLGRLWVGQGDTASNGTSEVDLSGVGVVGYSGISDMAGGLLFRNSTTGELTTTKIGSAFSNFDGLSRDDRLRYDTPSFSGFKLSTSAIADDRWDVAARYSGDLGSVKAKAAIAYGDSQGSADGRVNGSASIRHDSGVNFTVAAGSDDRDDRDPEFWYIKLGYLAKLNELGKTGFAVDYYDGSDGAAKDDESTSYGLLAAQNLDDFGTQFYLALRNYELDRPGTPTDDIFAVLAGARVKF